MKAKHYFLAAFILWVSLIFLFIYCLDTHRPNLLLCFGFIIEAICTVLLCIGVLKIWEK